MQRVWCRRGDLRPCTHQSRHWVVRCCRVCNQRRTQCRLHVFVDIGNRFSCGLPPPPIITRITDAVSRVEVTHIVVSILLHSSHKSFVVSCQWLMSLDNAPMLRNPFNTMFWLYFCKQSKCHARMTYCQLACCDKMYTTVGRKVVIDSLTAWSMQQEQFTLKPE